MNCKDHDSAGYLENRLNPFQRADALRQGRDLHQEQGQHDDRGDGGGDDEKVEEEMEKSFHGRSSGWRFPAWSAEAPCPRL